ncbi:hypothetical protein MBCUT_06720 [Methanobrevibacter cuticularis]|uniref:Uncharacterized protein n=1 Tax=Methanobrevibacter cuticularis TaxID=47311 RepID=A0A166EGP9_9EURY|nr:hypothetical protein [Methanobrevibacter cuticularis]KZX16634.1 hypothetical protein MBCUT_06720 [Methanobrevibacter cuticularis]
MPKYDSVEKHYNYLKMDFLFGVVEDDGSTVFLSLEKLAKKYNVSLSTLKKVSAREKWSKQKEDVGTKIDEKVLDKKSDYEAEKIVQIDTKYETAFSNLAKLTNDSVAMKKPKNVRSSDLRNFADTLITCYEGEKVAHGESLEQNNNTSDGWDALAKAFKEPANEQKAEED